MICLHQNIAELAYFSEMEVYIRSVNSRTLNVERCDSLPQL